MQSARRDSLTFATSSQRRQRRDGSECVLSRIHAQILQASAPFLLQLKVTTWVSIFREADFGCPFFVFFLVFFFWGNLKRKTDISISGVPNLKTPSPRVSGLVVCQSDGSDQSQGSSRLLCRSLPLIPHRTQPGLKHVNKKENNFTMEHGHGLKSGRDSELESNKS